VELVSLNVGLWLEDGELRRTKPAHPEIRVIPPDPKPEGQAADGAGTS
jgi:hypothetical protein